MRRQENPTLMVLTKLAVLLATSLADWTKCLLATGLVVLEEARRHALHSAEVCLATMVAAERTCSIIKTKMLNQQLRFYSEEGPYSTHPSWGAVFTIALACITPLNLCYRLENKNN